MSQKSGTAKLSSERIAKDIRWAMRKQYSAEEKIRIVPDGLRGEHRPRSVGGIRFSRAA
jgi:transposase